MATVTDNVFTEGLSGKLGASMLFRTLRGKTFVSTPARKPDKRKETSAQKNTRTNFKQATEWAQHILQDPEKKMYYQQKAKKLKLPNAYTAALTDYMRKPQLTTFTNKDQSIHYTVRKKDFALSKVEVVITKPEGDRILPATVKDKTWTFTLAKEDTPNVRIRVTDAVGRVMEMVARLELPDTNAVN